MAVNPLNQANREVCNVKIDWLKTGKPFLFLDTANVTTEGFSGDSVFALARGVNDIAFEEPMTGTITIEAQVLPFKVYALMSDGIIRSDAEWSVHEKVTATAADTLTVSQTPNGKVYVYPSGKYGDEDSLIEGTASGTTVTATGVTADTEYEVSYGVKKTNGVNRVSFGENYRLQDFTVTMDTVFKGEDGVFTPYIWKFYKAMAQRNFEISQQSTGDPATITITLDVLRDSDGNFCDMIEDLDSAS